MFSPASTNTRSTASTNCCHGTGNPRIRFTKRPHNQGGTERPVTTDAAASDGVRLREGLLDHSNTASDVWADTAYRSKANEDFMEKHGFVSKVHRKKPHLKPMPRHIQKSNAGKSVIRSRVEHVFADQKAQTGLFIRTVGITRATMRIGLANIVYNMRRFLLLERINAAA
ncbi:transposase [Acetobacter senegalensis]|uniref:Transposase n=1 Tax=Acetobacter senegalensis TaxID=446692 RepID=A0A0U5B4Q1_9PROT|nr:transposase [Acetobacter senegalensis]